MNYQRKRQVAVAIARVGGFWLGCAVLVALVVFGFAIWHGRSRLPTVTYFDIGQGDGIFIEMPNGRQVLIDGGPNNAIVEKIGRRLGPLDRTIDVLIATHMDADHITGALAVLQRYDVGTIITRQLDNDTKVSAAFSRAAAEEPAQHITADRELLLPLDDDCQLLIFAPTPRQMHAADRNTSSIVSQLQCRGWRLLFTGDAPQNVEAELVQQDVPSNVYMTGHHGSRSSSSPIFLDAVQPQFAIISAGRNNRYGHPHPDVVQRLLNLGITTFSTMQSGDITLRLGDQLEPVCSRGCQPLTAP